MNAQSNAGLRVEVVGGVVHIRLNGVQGGSSCERLGWNAILLNLTELRAMPPLNEPLKH
jgi:hypothetical protein